MIASILAIGWQASEGGSWCAQPLARGLRAKGGAVAFVNFENAKWPVAESSCAHALATPVVPLANPVELKGVGKSAFLGTFAALSLHSRHQFFL